MKSILLPDRSKRADACQLWKLRGSWQASSRHHRRRGAAPGLCRDRGAGPDRRRNHSSGRLERDRVLPHRAPDASTPIAAAHSPRWHGARFRWRGGSAIEDGALGSLAPRPRRDRSEPTGPPRRAHDGTGGGAVRQWPARSDGAARRRPRRWARPCWSTGTPAPRPRAHPVGHADPAQGQAGVADRGGGCTSRQAPASRKPSATWQPTASTQPKDGGRPRIAAGRGHPGRGRCRSAPIC